MLTTLFLIGMSLLAGILTGGFLKIMRGRGRDISHGPFGVSERAVPKRVPKGSWFRLTP